MLARSSGGWSTTGWVFLASTSAEILLRRILALAIHSGTGSWQIAEKIEELPTESAFSCVPESLLKEIVEQVKNELKLASLAKQVTP
jgi:hypothetical protein